MASIHRYQDGLGRGEFLSPASHPSGKIKKEKAENFSFHQNRKELGGGRVDGEMPGGGRDASSTLRWSSGKASPQALALGGPLAQGRPWVTPVGQPQFPGGAFLLPSAQARVHSWIHTDAHVSPSSPATQTRVPIPVRPPPPDPQEKRSLSGWGLGAAALPTALEHCPGSLVT